MSIGENIRLRRKERGLTQFELADLAHISRSYLGDVERGRYNPSVETLHQIAEVLNVPVSALMGDTASLAELVAADAELKAAYDLISAGRGVSGEQLSRAKQQLINAVASMTDDQAAALLSIVDQVVS